MKKLVVLLSFLFPMFKMVGQVQTIDTYSLSAYGLNYSISANIDVDESLYSDLLYVFAETGSDDFAVLRMGPDHIKHMVDKLTKAKDIYLAWSSIAREKNMKQLSKKIMNLRGTCFEIDFTNEGKWYRDDDNKLFATFYVDKDGLCYLKVESYILYGENTAYRENSSLLSFAYSRNILTMGTAFSNRTVRVGKTANGVQMTFSNAREIDDFLKKLENAVAWKEQNMEFGKVLKKR